MTHSDLRKTIAKCLIVSGVLIGSATTLVTYFQGAQAQTAGQPNHAGVPDMAPMPGVDEISSAASSVERGEALFGYYCMSCHGAGREHPGTESLEKKYGDRQPAPLAQRTNLTPNLTKYYVRVGVAFMPFFRKTEISDADLDDIARYLARNIPQPVKLFMR